MTHRPSNLIRLSTNASAMLAKHVAASGQSAEQALILALDQYKDCLKAEGKLDSAFEWSN